MSPRTAPAPVPAAGDGRHQANEIIRARTEALRRTVEQLVPDGARREVAGAALDVFLQHIAAALAE